MYNLYTKFVKILEICKQFSENLVNEFGNVPRRSPVPKFSDLEVLQEENVAKWGVPVISRKLLTSVSVLRKTHTILAISYTLSVG